jgi:2-desacetyl-2-hydroxyethyl bacteriochlorophyllide A dehydrogenase
MNNLSVVWEEKGKVSVQERPIHQPKSDEVLIKVNACGLCGTDLHIVSGEFTGALPGVVIGHECSGTIMEIGSEVKAFQVGDRVAVDPNRACGTCSYCLDGRVHLCRNMVGLGSHRDGTLRQFATLSQTQCVRIPSGLDDQIASLAEPLACVLHAIDRARIAIGYPVIVIGAGPIGLMAAHLARLQGASDVTVIEANETRVDRARTLGFACRVPDEGEAELADYVFECAGNARAMEYALKVAKPGGTVVWVGVAAPDAEVRVRPFDVFRRELSILGSFVNPHTTRRAVETLANGSVDWRSLISHSFSLSDFAEAWRLHSSGQGIKICLRPNG